MSNHEVLINEEEHGEVQHKEKHLEVGEFLKSLVYGGLDGLVNTLSVLVGGYASGASIHHVTAVTIAVIIGDGLGMALGDYLSSKSEAEYIKSEETRETWEIRNKLVAEKRELKEIYVNNGYSEEESSRLADLISRNEKAFVDIMMLQELGLAVEEGNPIINGVVTFFSFAIFGFFPIIPYVVSKALDNHYKTMLLIALGVGALFLFVLGFAKAIITGSNKISSGLMTLVLGAIATAAGFGAGAAVGINDS